MIKSQTYIFLIYFAFLSFSSSFTLAYNNTVKLKNSFFPDPLMIDSLSPELIRGPYLQMGGPDRMTLRWRTDSASMSALNFGIQFNNLDQSFIDTTLKTEHIVELSGLDPNTRYFYELYSTADTLLKKDSMHYFMTSPLVGENQLVRIWALGDCGTKNDNQRAVRDAYYDFIDSSHTDLILLLGDNAYESGTDQQYQSAIFENMYENILKRSVLWSTVGNHDLYTSNASTQSGPYYDIFSFPTQGECGGIPSGTESYYAFDYSNIHFIVLNSNDTSKLTVGGTMYNWCENDLQNADADWTIVFFHHPPYTKGNHDSDTEKELVKMRNNFIPLLESYGVDLVLCGHSHSYERSYFLNGHTGISSSFDSVLHTIGDNGYGDGNINGDGAYQKNIAGIQAGNGAVYLTAGSSGKISGGSLNHPAMFRALNELGSCYIEVLNNRLDLKFINNDSLVNDHFTIIKDLSDTIDPIQANNEIRILPNPALDFITLESDKMIEYVQIFDMSGKEISHYLYNNQQIRFSNISAGVYILAATFITGERAINTFSVIK